MTARSIVRSIILPAALLPILLTAGCGGPGKSFGGDGAPQPPLEGPAETIALYRSHCLSCHGNDLTGNMGAATNIRQVGSRLDRDAIRQRIAQGGDLMPAFADKLKEEEIDALADWLAALK